MTCEETYIWFRCYQVLSIGCGIWIIVDLIGHGMEWYKRRQSNLFFTKYEPDPETLTCFHCNSREICAYVNDPYNTDGDCLASK